MSNCTLCPGDTCNGACQEVPFDEYMAACAVPPPEPTAIEPARVMVLTEDEQRELHELLLLDEGRYSPVITRLRDRIAFGDEYNDAPEEIARRTLRKRRLETEIKRENRRIDDLQEPVIEAIQAASATNRSLTLEFARIQRDDRVDLIYANPNWRKDEQAAAREAAGQIMQSLGPPFADFVQPAYNASSVGAFFRERYRNAVEAELDKPEHERQAVDPAAMLPEELRAYLTLHVKPKVKVTQR